MRLDKYLAQAGMGTRSEVKKWIRSGRVLLDGQVAERPEMTVKDGMEICLDGELVCRDEYEYFMLYKPAGVISATKDGRERTVLELITCPHVPGLFPIGRLDKDTEGLLIMTNDGAMAHRLLSPKKHVEKTYLVRVSGEITDEDVNYFAQGIDIGDKKLTEPARIFDEEIIAGKMESECKITITEGRYHQIKRMFMKVGKPVLYLKRLSMGGLFLDESLGSGGYRRLTQDELDCLKEAAGLSR